MRLEDITPQQALDTLEKVVAEKGADYMYERPDGDSCVYTTADSAPSCIVGHVVAALAPELIPAIHDREWYAPLEEGAVPFVRTSWAASGRFTTSDNMDNEEHFGGPVAHILSAAQSFQDDGYSWGEALEAAKTRAAEVSA